MAQNCLRQAVIGLAVVLLMCTTMGECSGDRITLKPNTTQTVGLDFTNGTEEKPQVLPLQRPCGPNHEGFCFNGKCLYTPDLDTLSCRCEPNFSGERCQHVLLNSQGLPNSEEIVGITCGVLLLLACFVVLLYFLYKKRCWTTPTQYKTYNQNTV